MKINKPGSDSVFLLIVIFLILVLAGCANPINSYTKHEYDTGGAGWEQKGNYEEAKECYRRALINAQIGHLGPGEESQAMYNFARMTGYLGNFEEAERLLLEALKLEEKATGPDSEISDMRFFELARLQFDEQKFEKSASYYEKAISIADKFDTERKAPIAYAAELDKYALSLEKINQKDRARDIRARANKLRNENRGKKPEFVPLHYNTTYAGLCSKKGEWEKAFGLLEKALINIEAINSTVESESRAYIYYEYGRAAGVTCRFDLAEKYLHKAYEVDEKNSSYTFMDFSELARLNYDQKKYAEACNYFAQAKFIIEKRNLISGDPIGYAALLDEYSDSLYKIGKAAEADSVKNKAQQIRSNNQGEKSKTDRTPYGKYCK